jgi:hypothetical protein
MSHNDLYDFLNEITAEMEAEYQRIRKTASCDPGTAGDEGEENWAELLRDWLPSNYHVVTKGQIMGLNGSLSPQVDVLVLDPNYPKRLRNKKKYFAEGVKAAFECKLTLSKQHIYDTLKKSAQIKELVRSDIGTPYKELNSPIVYGLLAHSHNWKGSKRKSAKIISRHLFDADALNIKHPREMLDLLCVANLTTWVTSKEPLIKPEGVDDTSSSEVGPSTCYFCYSEYADAPEWKFKFTPVGAFLAALLIKLAWEDTSLRGLASYFHSLDLLVSAVGEVRDWPMSVYSDEIRDKVTYENLSDEMGWDEWGPFIE